MGGGRDLCVVELGEQLGDNSIHYSGFGLLGDMLTCDDQTKKFQEEEKVLDNRLQKRSQQPTVIEARLPGYKPQDLKKPQEQKKQDGKFADSELNLQASLAQDERFEGDDERRSPIYMEISHHQLQQVKMNVTRPEEKVGVKMQVEPYADSLDLLPLEVEVKKTLFCVPQILIINETINFLQSMS